MNLYRIARTMDGRFLGYEPRRYTRAWVLRRARRLARDWPAHTFTVETSRGEAL